MSDDQYPLVLELAAGSVAASYCGRMLRSAGFRIVKIEPRAGDPLRRVPPLLGRGHNPSGALFHYLNSGKESVVVDIDGPDTLGQIDSLVQAADIAILAVDGNATQVDALQAAIAERSPQCIRVVTSPFGLTGPYRDLPQTDITDWAAGGYMFITGDPDREPLQGGGPQPAYATGLTAAIGALGAWLEPSDGGRLVDVSTFESMAALHQFTITQYTHMGFIKRRGSNRHPEAHHPVAFLECADGWVCIAAAGQAEWERLVHVVGVPELLADPRFESAGDRFDHADAVDEALRPWLMSHSAAEIEQILQDNRVPASRVARLDHVVSHKQLRSRGFLVDVDVDGEKVTMPGQTVDVGASTAASAAGPALGQHGLLPSRRASRARLHGRPEPLSGVRVLDMTRAWSGPLAGRFIADLGADVIHVEYSTARAAGVVGPKGYRTDAGTNWSWGDLPAPHLRGGVFPFADPGDDPWNRQGYFNKLHRNKRSLCLNLHEPEGHEIFHRLVAQSDVVLHNYSPRGARSLGVVFELLQEINPKIVVVSISGYGHTGPAHDRVALGPLMEAESGLGMLTGYRDGEPRKLGAAMPDAIAGLNGAIGVLAALKRRDETGAGLFVDVSMLECFVGVAGEALAATSVTGRPPARHANRSAHWAPQGVFRCTGDDEWVALAVRTGEEWDRLVALLGAAPLTDPRFCDLTVREREQPFLERTIGAWTAARTKWDAWAALRSHGIPSMPVMCNADIVHDPQLAHRGFIIEMDQPGVGIMRYPGFPIQYEPPFPHRFEPTAPLGRDNRAILRELGFNDHAVDDLERRGVLSDRPN